MTPSADFRRPPRDGRALIGIFLAYAGAEDKNFLADHIPGEHKWGCAGGGDRIRSVETDGEVRTCGEAAVLKRMREQRKALSVTLWLVVFAFIGTTFLVWGFRSTSGPAGLGAIATVEGEKIPYTEYQQAYQRQYRQYQAALGDKFDEKILERLNLKGQVVEGLVSRHLLLREARRLGLVIAPDELAAEITRVPAFSDTSGFSRDRYLRTLQSVRLTPERFEESLREDLLLRKVEAWIKGGVHLLPDEVWEAFRFHEASVNVEYLLFSDTKAQQAAIQKVVGLARDKKPWEEIIKAAGLKPLTSGFFSLNRDLPQIPDQERFKEAALALDRGAMSALIQGTKASYLLRVIDRKEPDVAQFEREKNQFSLGLLRRKQDQVFAEWVRQARGRAKVQIDTANL